MVSCFVFGASQLLHAGSSIWNAEKLAHGTLLPRPERVRSASSSRWVAVFMRALCCGGDSKDEPDRADA